MYLKSRGRLLRGKLWRLFFRVVRLGVEVPLPGHRPNGGRPIECLVKTAKLTSLAVHLEKKWSQRASVKWPFWTAYDQGHLKLTLANHRARGHWQKQCRLLLFLLARVRGKCFYSSCAAHVWTGHANSNDIQKWTGLKLEPTQVWPPPFKRKTSHVQRGNLSLKFPSTARHSVFFAFACQQRAKSNDYNHTSKRTHCCNKTSVRNFVVVFLFYLPFRLAPRFAGSLFWPTMSMIAIRLHFCYRFVGPHMILHGWSPNCLSQILPCRDWTTSRLPWQSSWHLTEPSSG